MRTSDDQGSITDNNTICTQTNKQRKKPNIPRLPLGDKLLSVELKRSLNSWSLVVGVSSRSPKYMPDLADDGCSHHGSIGVHADSRQLSSSSASQLKSQSDSLSELSWSSARINRPDTNRETQGKRQRVQLKKKLLWWKTWIITITVYLLDFSKVFCCGKLNGADTENTSEKLGGTASKMYTCFTLAHAHTSELRIQTPMGEYFFHMQVTQASLRHGTEKICLLAVHDSKTTHQMQSRAWAFLQKEELRKALSISPGLLLT